MGDCSQASPERTNEKSRAAESSHRIGEGPAGHEDPGTVDPDHFEGRVDGEAGDGGAVGDVSGRAIGAGKVEFNGGDREIGADQLVGGGQGQGFPPGRADLLDLLEGRGLGGGGKVGPFGPLGGGE